MTRTQRLRRQHRMLHSQVLRLLAAAAIVGAGLATLGARTGAQPAPEPAGLRAPALDAAATSAGPAPLPVADLASPAAAPTAPNAATLVGPARGPARQRDAFVPGRVLLPVPVLSQLPQLPNGCEVTSLAMLLAAAGHPVDKGVLARAQPTDPRQPVFAGRRADLSAVRSWGDPDDGFVGRVDGAYGYGIYHSPLGHLLDGQLPGRARDLTGLDFQDVLVELDAGSPVLLWSTTTGRPARQWVHWQGPHGPVTATYSEHALVLVGKTATQLILNDPLKGRQVRLAPAPFIQAWRELGRQALAVRP